MWLLAGVRLLRALRMSHRFTLFHSAYCMCRFLLGWFVLFVLVLFVFGSVFCMCGRHLFDYSCGCIQMTDHASSLVRLC